MVACQKINQIAGKTIFGIVSNGKMWEFAKLKDNFFTKNLKSYRISDLEELFGALHYVFQQCQLQLVEP